MRPSVAFRWTGAWWFLPILFGLGSLHAATSLAVQSGYSVSDVANTSYVIYLMAPLLSGYAAFSGRSWRRFHAVSRSRRSGMVVIANSYAPLLIGGPAIVMASVLISASTLPYGTSVWAVLLLDVMAVLACILLGIALGLVLPTVVAVPSVAVATFVWIAYLPATGSEYLHHITPTITGCCAPSVEPSSMALRSLLVLLTIVCFGIVSTLFSREWSRHSRISLVGAIVLSVALGFLGATASLVAAGDDLKLTLVQPRTDPVECDTIEGVRACSWSEGRKTAGRAAQLAADLNADLQSWSFPEITEVGSSESAHGLVIDTSPGKSGRALELTLVEGYVREELGCPAEGREAVGARTAFLLIALRGATSDELSEEFSPEAIASGEQYADAVASATGGGDELSAWFFDEAARSGCKEDSL